MTEKFTNRKRKLPELGDKENNQLVDCVIPKIDSNEDLLLNVLIERLTDFLKKHPITVVGHSKSSFITALKQQPHLLRSLNSSELKQYLHDLKQLYLAYDLDSYEEFTHNILPIAEEILSIKQAGEGELSFLNPYHKAKSPRTSTTQVKVHFKPPKVPQYPKIIMKPSLSQQSHEDDWLSFPSSHSSFKPTKHTFPRICNIIMKEFNSLQRHSLFQLNNMYYNYSKISNDDKAYYQELANTYNNQYYYSGEFYSLDTHFIHYFQEEKIRTEYNQDDHGIINGYYFYLILHQTIVHYYHLLTEFNRKQHRQQFLPLRSVSDELHDIPISKKGNDELRFEDFAKNYLDVLYLHSALQYRHEVPRMKIRSYKQYNNHSDDTTEGMINYFECIPLIKEREKQRKPNEKKELSPSSQSSSKQNEKKSKKVKEESCPERYWREVEDTTGDDEDDEIDDLDCSDDDESEDYEDSDDDFDLDGDGEGNEDGGDEDHSVEYGQYEEIDLAGEQNNQEIGIEVHDDNDSYEEEEYANDSGCYTLSSSFSIDVTAGGRA